MKPPHPLAALPVLLLASLATVTTLLPACGRSPVLINGAGATFPFPLYSKWFYEYNKLHPDCQINYQSIGSGGGIRQLTAHTVDFGASDAPMTSAELREAPDTLHVPTVIGAVVVTHRVPGVTGGLRLSQAALADIFLGTIRRWDDPRIQATNPGVALPALPITVVHRSDGSGTTDIFTDYLAHVSPRWRAKVGSGKSVKWPVGLGDKGNEGVTGLVQTLPGTIAYVEYAFAEHNGLPMAALQNRRGRFIAPTMESASRAAIGLAMPADFRVSLVDPPGEDAYPVAAFTYILIDQHQRDARKGAELIHFLQWALSDGQRDAKALGYAPLPPLVAERVLAALRTVTLPSAAPEHDHAAH